MQVNGEDTPLIRPFQVHQRHVTVLLCPAAINISFAASVTFIIAAIKDASVETSSFMPIEIAAWTVSGLLVGVAWIGRFFPRAFLVCTLIITLVSFSAALVLKTVKTGEIEMLVIAALANSAISVSCLTFVIGCLSAFTM